MFLESLVSRNPALIEASVAIHQAGDLSPNTYVIDLDTVASNTETFVAEAHARQLTVYAMTKQLGRAPGVLDIITNAGVDGYVAVDLDGADAVVRGGHNLGHVGHLVQVHRGAAKHVAAMEPDYWTVFSPNKARQAAGASQSVGRVQSLLVRVHGAGDEFYDGHEGGVAVEDLADAIDFIGRLDGAHFAGITTFPALIYDLELGRVRPTTNTETVAKAAEIAHQHGPQEGLQINLPGTTSTHVLDMLADLGATQVEPGHGLTGTTPLHTVMELPERPAVLYLSEVSHVHTDTPLCFGGGLYVDPVFGDYDAEVLVGTSPKMADLQRVGVTIPDPAAIDYYAKLQAGTDRSLSEGDSVVFGFRIQAFVTRATVTGLTGVASGSPRVVGTWTQDGRRVDQDVV